MGFSQWAACSIRIWLPGCVLAGALIDHTKSTFALWAPDHLGLHTFSMFQGLYPQEPGIILTAPKAVSLRGREALPCSQVNLLAEMKKQMASHPLPHLALCIMEEEGEENSQMSSFIPGLCGAVDLLPTRAKSHTTTPHNPALSRHNRRGRVGSERSVKQSPGSVPHQTSVNPRS